MKKPDPSQTQASNDPEENQDLPPMPDVDADLRGVLDQIGGGNVSVEISRVVQGASRPMFLATWQGSEFSKQTLAEAFGGGNYYVRVRKPDGTYATHGTVAIDPSVKAKPSAPEPAKADPVLTALLETMKAMGEEIKALKPAPVAAPAPDPLKQLETLASVMKTLQPTGAAAPDATMVATLAELRAEVRELRERDKGGGLAETIALLKTAWDLKPDSGGDSGSMWERVAEKVADGLPQIAAALRPAAPPVPRTLPARALPDAVHASASIGSPGASTPGDSAPPESGAPSPGPDSGHADPAGRDLMDGLFDAAENNVSVEQVESFLQDHLSKARYDGLLDTLESDGWHAELFGSDERAARHRVWLTNLRNFMLAANTEADDEPEAEPAGSVVKKGAVTK